MVSPGRAVSPAHPVVGGDRQAIGPLPTGVVEGRGQGVHREDRLSHPGRTDAVNPVLVNRYTQTIVLERIFHILSHMA